MAPKFVRPKLPRVATLQNKISTNPASAIPTDFLAIDEEGYFLQEGLRVADVELGHDWLSRLRIDERGRAHLKPSAAYPEEKRIFVEAFDQPLVANDIEIGPEALLTARFPYGFETEIAPESLRVDEWDRFHARTKDGVPVVLNRSAQSRFFELATDFDDESVSFGDVTLATEPLYQELDAANAPEWWNERYRTADTRWDLGEAHSLLETLVPPLKFSRSRVLILGCGAGHDAAWWEKRGHIVTGVDFSVEALRQAKVLYGESDNLKWVHADVLKLPVAWTSRFDIIFEHTLFCAVQPSKRDELIRTWWRLLTPRGRLMGFVPVIDKFFGPPFGVSEWEMRRRLLEAPTKGPVASRRARFLPLLWSRQRNSVEKRLGQELFFVVERADSLTD